MEKVLINLFVPALEEKFDVYVPCFMEVEQVCALLSRSLANISRMRYIPSGQEFLCSIDRDLLLQKHNTLGDYNIANGEHLMMC